MTVLRRREIKTDEEQKIVTGLILSTRFAREILPVLDQSFLQTEYARIIAKWCREYYDRYKEAPAGTIKDIYLVEKDKLRDESTAELVRVFLENLSQKYEQSGEVWNNDAFHTDRAIEYLSERCNVLMAERVQAAYAVGKPEEARKAIAEHREVQRKMSSWVNPFDQEYAVRVYESQFGYEGQEDDRPVFLFRFPGLLGTFMGPFDRGWLTAFMGPMKRGKSWWLLECAMQAMKYGRKVVFITLEMSDEEVSARWYQRLLAETKESGRFAYPVFDCLHNQDGSCSQPGRTNRERLLLQDGSKPQFEPSLSYRPCSVCRGRKTYKRETWFEAVERPRISNRSIEVGVKGFSSQWGENMRILAYPEGDANLSRISGDLDDLEYTEGFVADVVVIDYADILGREQEGAGDDEQANTDLTWLNMRKMAGKRHVAVITGTQAVRETLDSKSVRASHTGRDIRKMAHVINAFFLSQTDQEKDAGVMRISKFQRHAKFNQSQYIRVLQMLDLGQTAVDSQW